MAEVQAAYDPVTIAVAAERLEVPQPTLRVWASRHNARKLARTGKTVWYDYNDLATIEAHLHLGKRVPITPELRDAYRAQLRAAA
ncbi:MerR family transcriptional regulator [Nonomuraea basaltis]|uniref:MerR family transcriptional regulator n=1 Tax=Nonomuraea basaltis TaxID=2495887 RepID=UPI00110C6913|nr:MerR family transcriptional regulator [Nonomuraea basaltis]TMS00160.1 hypothetical protein EJK15_03555 [Nonomuraea basaltis]